MKKSANWGGCYLPRSPRPSSKLRTLHILRKPNSIIVLLFLQNNSKFKNKLKHSNLGRCKHIDNASLSGLILGDQSLLRSANIFQIADVVRRVIFFCSCDVFRQYFALNRVKFSTTVSPFCSYYQNNSTRPQVFTVNRSITCNKVAPLTSFWRHRFNMTKFFPNLANSSWLWWIMRVVLNNQKRGNILINNNI